MAINSFARAGLPTTNTNFIPNANFSDTATGTYSSGGINYKFLTLTSTGTINITNAGYADVLVIGGGGGAARTDLVTAGAGGGAFRQETVFLTVSSITVTVGGGGSHASGSPGQVSGAVGNASSLGTIIKSGGGGQASARNYGLFGGTVTFVSPSSGGDGAPGGACFRETNAGASQQGNGCGGTVHATNAIDGRTSSLNNTSTEYGKGGAATGSANGAANTGNGGAGGEGNGGSGIVIVRVRTN